MNWNYILLVAPYFLDAGLLVLQIGGVGILGSLLLGKVVAVLRYYRIPVLAQISAVYVELSRNTPLLIQLFFLYFGLPKVGVRLDAETCAIVGLIFLGGSYMAEAFRTGYDDVDRGQVEAAETIGLTRSQTFWAIIIPQSLKLSFSSLGANIIFLLKETSVFSAVALADLTFVAKDLIGMHYNTDEALILLVLSYAVILIPIAIAVTLVDKRLNSTKPSVKAVK